MDGTANPKGYRRIVALGRRHGQDRLWAIEGPQVSGAGLTAVLTVEGEQVVEVDRPSRQARPAGAKSDEIDAVRAARQAIAGEGAAQPRCRGEREAVRTLLDRRGPRARHQPTGAPAG